METCKRPFSRDRRIDSRGLRAGSGCARQRDRLKPHWEEIHDGKGTVGDEEITQAIEDGKLLLQEERCQHWFIGYPKLDRNESEERYHGKCKRKDDTRCSPLWRRWLSVSHGGRYVLVSAHRLLVAVPRTQECEKREDLF